MNLIALIFRLLQDHAHFEGDDFARLKGKGESWYADIRTDDEEDNQTNPILKKGKKIAEQWWFQTLNAVLFIYLSRKIWDYLNPQQEVYEDQPQPKNRMF